MSTPTVYLYRQNDCKYEGMTKEQIISAITDAVTETREVSAGYVSSLKDINRGSGIKFWVGTTAEYNALAPADDTIYIISDDTTHADLIADIQAIDDSLIVTHIDISEATTDISNAQGDITDVAESLDSAETRVSAIGTDITDLQPEITSYEEKKRARYELWSGNRNVDVQRNFSPAFFTDTDEREHLNSCRNLIIQARFDDGSGFSQYSEVYLTNVWDRVSPFCIKGFSHGGGSKKEVVFSDCTISTNRDYISFNVPRFTLGSSNQNDLYITKIIATGEI